MLNKSKTCFINNTILSLEAVTTENNYKLKTLSKEKNQELKFLKVQIVLLRNEIREFLRMKQQINNYLELTNKVYSIINNFKPKT